MDFEKLQLSTFRMHRNISSNFSTTNKYPLVTKPPKDLRKQNRTCNPPSRRSKFFDRPKLLIWKQRQTKGCLCILSLGQSLSGKEHLGPEMSAAPPGIRPFFLASGPLTIESIINLDSPESLPEALIFYISFYFEL